MLVSATKGLLIYSINSTEINHSSKPLAMCSIMEYMASGLDELFVNIRPNLAKNIKPPINKAGIYDHAPANTEASTFLHPIDENELLNVVTNWKRKSSTDYD